MYKQREGKTVTAKLFFSYVVPGLTLVTEVKMETSSNGPRLSLGVKVRNLSPAVEDIF